MRFNDTAVLAGVSAVQRADGSFDEVIEARTVFVNSYSLGATAFLAAKSAGLHADAEVQVRSCDYRGEQRCVFHGTEYEVERVAGSGDFSVLTLRRRVRNA